MSPRLQAILALPRVTHSLTQGTDAWHQFRLQHRGASEAAAVLGLSRKVKRSELLHAKHTGIAREFSDWLQRNVLDHGHEVEALARPHVEQLPVVGDELYPVTCSRGLLSASCDGLTMDDRVAFEHKQWNDELANMVGAGLVPDEHMPQCQQILLVTGAEKVVFVVSDGTSERMVWAEVTPDTGWWERIVAAWEQFDADLEVYQPAEPEAPKPVGRAPEALPALRIEVTGMVTASNLTEFKAHALAVFQGINRTLSTDEDFANAEKTVKWCGEVEDRLKAAKQHALAQTESIDALFRAIDDISGEARSVRLELDRLVKAEKERRRGEIVSGAAAALRKYVDGLNARLGQPFMPASAAAADFGGCIKGLKSLASMEDKVATTLANAKIAANEIADRIQVNMQALVAAGDKAAFPDASTLVLKAPEDLRAIIAGRVAEQERKEAARLEAERARIRAEEEARARAQAQREQQEREAAERRAHQATMTHSNGAPMFGEAIKENGDHVMLDKHGKRSVFCDVDEGAESASSAANVVPMPTKAPAATAGVPTLKLGDVQKHLAPLSITAEGLRQLGFEPAGRDRAAVLFHDADLPLMIGAAIQHLAKVREQLVKVA